MSNIQSGASSKARLHQPSDVETVAAAAGDQHVPTGPVVDEANVWDDDLGRE